MAGTEGTGQYHVVVATKLGRVGYRPLGGGFRVRVEPRDPAAAAVLAGSFPASEWRQPEGSWFRFSTTVVDGKVAARKALNLAIKAVGSSAKLNPLSAEPNTAPKPEAVAK